MKNEKTKPTLKTMGIEKKPVLIGLANKDSVRKGITAISITHFKFAYNSGGITNKFKDYYAKTWEPVKSGEVLFFKIVTHDERTINLNSRNVISYEDGVMIVNVEEITTKDSVITIETTYSIPRNEEYEAVDTLIPEESKQFRLKVKRDVRKSL